MRKLIVTVLVELFCAAIFTIVSTYIVIIAVLRRIFIEDRLNLDNFDKFSNWITNYSQYLVDKYK